MSTKFGIEWIYSEFRIARLNHGDCVEAWCSPVPVNNLSELSDAMYEASHHIDFRGGGDLAIAYEDDLHTHQFVEIPEMSKKDLEKYIQRRVEREKSFDGEAAYCYHPAKRGYDNHGVLLHLMPKGIVDAVIRICEEYYLLPKRLVPLTEILSEHVPKFSAAEKDVVLVVAIFNLRVQLLISHGDGEILFVRELVHSWQHDKIDRLIMEINRTIGYSRQRIGPQLAKVWLIGDYAPEFISAFKQGLNAPVELDETTISTAFWMTEVAGLPQQLSSNFIPRLARRAITRKTTMRIAVVAAFFLCIGAVTIFSSVEAIILKRGINNKEIKSQITSLDNRIIQLNSELTKIEKERTRLDHLTADAFNLPAIFVSHLGDLAPEGLTLTTVDINRSSGHWEIKLGGVSPLSLTELAGTLTELESNLAGPPWNTEITQSWQQAWMEQLRQGGAITEANIGFEIMGRLR